MSKPVYIIKLGTTFDFLVPEYGDFDAWTARVLAPGGLACQSIDAEHAEPLPDPADCAAAVLTGSHRMITDQEPWSQAVQHWLAGLLDQEIPILGICYGHQLLAQAAGGHVAYHPRGREIGTVQVHTRPECAGDPLFSSISNPFYAHTAHSQSVISLPPGAVHLAENKYEPHHAFRIGRSAWGVQFHPEFTTDIMRAYILEQRSELQAGQRDIDPLLKTVRATPQAAQIAALFATYVQIHDH